MVAELMESEATGRGDFPTALAQDFVLRALATISKPHSLWTPRLSLQIVRERSEVLPSAGLQCLSYCFTLKMTHRPDRRGEPQAWPGHQCL